MTETTLTTTTATPMSLLPPSVENCARDGRMHITTKSIVDCTSTTIKGGVVTNMPRHVYDSIRRLNVSSLADGLVDHEEVDPNSTRYAFETPNRPRAAAQQDRLDRGTLTHMLLLQPERIATDVAVWTGGKRASAAWDQFEADNGGKMIVREEDFAAVSLACKEFRSCRKVAELLTELDAEVALFSDEFAGSLYTKGMIDAITRGPVCNMIDIKTTDGGITNKGLEYTIRDFRYREKMAMYRRMYQKETGREVVGCYDLFLSMTPPYGVRVVKITTQALEWGEQRMLAVAESVLKCLNNGSFPMFARDGEAMVAEFEQPDDEIGGIV